MNKFLFNLKYIVLTAFVALTACVSDDLADVGDIQDITGPTPFYNITNVTSSEFDCSDNELSADYDFNFQAGSNLAVNGIAYQWSITPSEGVTLINKNLPILEQSIEAEKAVVIAIEKEIAKLDFKIPCESDLAKVTVFEAQINALEIQLAEAEAALSDDDVASQNIIDLENQISSLESATFEDQELIISFPTPGDYTVGLTVTDNLNKSDYIEKIITVLQAVPTIPVPEIGEPSFEDNSLFDGTGDGRDSWRAPSSSRWGSVFQINTDSNPVDAPNLPDGRQAAKFPADGTRTGYQEIQVTPGAKYVLTYFSAFEENTYGDLTVSIINTNADSKEDALLEENIIASRTDNNIGRVDNVFKKHALTFEAGTNESVIILLRGSGVESRLDAFEILVKE